MKKEVTIVGSGLVGSLCAIYMTKRGYTVNVFERRNDLRSEIITAGKSINLALSKRGWTALEKVGVENEVKKIAIPMYKRIMHDNKGNLTEQPYGNDGEAIYSVSRVSLNVLLMNLASKSGAKLNFNEKCIDACHLNLHKTFAIPHGGGGPGVGPIGVVKHLKPFLPNSPLVKMGGDQGMSISSAPWGSALVLTISYAYIKMLGADGLRKSTEVAILNANYIKQKLSKNFDILYTGSIILGWILCKAPF